MCSQGKVIEVHIGTLLSDQAFTFTDWTGNEGKSLHLYLSATRVSRDREESYPDHDRQGYGQRKGCSAGLGGTKPIHGWLD